MLYMHPPDTVDNYAVRPSPDKLAELQDDVKEWGKPTYGLSFIVGYYPNFYR